MELLIREWAEQDLTQAVEIWNTVVRDGAAFPQEELLTEDAARAFFREQTFTAVAAEGETVLGLYILHPNNIGRCGHIANASYAVKKTARDRGIGERLVRHCMEKAALCGFRILQFNAVVRSNSRALHLYEKLGFRQLGIIPGGFRLDDGTYEDIIPHYCLLGSG